MAPQNGGMMLLLVLGAFSLLAILAPKFGFDSRVSREWSYRDVAQSDLGSAARH